MPAYLFQTDAVIACCATRLCLLAASPNSIDLIPKRVKGDISLCALYSKYNLWLANQEQCLAYRLGANLELVPGEPGGSNSKAKEAKLRAMV